MERHQRKGGLASVWCNIPSIFLLLFLPALFLVSEAASHGPSILTPELVARLTRNLDSGDSIELYSLTRYAEIDFGFTEGVCDGVNIEPVEEYERRKFVGSRRRRLEVQAGTLFPGDATLFPGEPILFPGNATLFPGNATGAPVTSPPTKTGTAHPSASPSGTPSDSPFAAPSAHPSASPSSSPSSSPTHSGPLPKILHLKSALAFRYFRSPLSSFYSTPKPPFQYTIEFGPHRTPDGADAAVHLCDNGKYPVQWDDTARVYHSDTFDPKEWDTAVYLAPISGAVLTRLLGDAARFRVGERYQPFSVLDWNDPQGKPLVESSTSDDFVWDMFNRLADMDVDIHPVLVPVRRNVAFHASYVEIVDARERFVKRKIKKFYSNFRTCWRDLWVRGDDVIPEYVKSDEVMKLALPCLGVLLNSDDDSTDSLENLDWVSPTAYLYVDGTTFWKFSLRPPYWDVNLSYLSLPHPAPLPPSVIEPLDVALMVMVCLGLLVGAVMVASRVGFMNKLNSEYDVIVETPRVRDAIPLSMGGIEDDSEGFPNNRGGGEYDAFYATMTQSNSEPDVSGSERSCGGCGTMSAKKLSSNSLWEAVERLGQLESDDGPTEFVSRPDLFSNSKVAMPVGYLEQQQQQSEENDEHDEESWDEENGESEEFWEAKPLD